MAPSKTAKERYTSAKKSMWPGVYLNMTSHLEEHLDNFEFDIQLVKSLVQKIEVSADKRIRIVFGFRDVFTELGKESAET